MQDSHQVRTETEDVLGADARELSKRACTIIEANLALRDDETLVVVADETTYDIGRLFYDSARSMGKQALLTLMPEGSVSGEEPPAAIGAAMKAADVALCPTAKSITHTTARIEAAKTGTRVVTMPGITLDMLREGAACADYAAVEKRTRELSERLTKAQSARIEKDGCVLELNLQNRAGIASPGVYREPGACGNFPSGEAYIAPLETQANGTIVVDGSMVGIGTLEHPLVITLENGRISAIDGADGNESYREQLAILLEKPENGTIAELGIGTNERAKLCGIILEDEKLYGTVHVAFGTNASFGGVTHADCHYDGIVLAPTLYLDDELVIDHGVFCD